MHNAADNLLHPDSLEWVLDAIRFPIFGEHPYPTIIEKAAILAWTIIKGHVFFDGNKRTGMSAMIVFLRENGYEFGATDDEIVESALRIARAGQSEGQAYSFEAFSEWVGEKARMSDE